MMTLNTSSRISWLEPIWLTMTMFEHVESDQPPRWDLAGDNDEGSRPDRRFDAFCLTVGANYRGIVKSSEYSDAIPLGIR